MILDIKVITTFSLIIGTSTFESKSITENSCFTDGLCLGHLIKVEENVQTSIACLEQF